MGDLTYDLTVVNNTYDSTNYHYLYVATEGARILKYSLPDLTYIGTITSPSATQLNGGCLYEAEGYIFYNPFGLPAIAFRLDVRTDTFISTATNIYSYWSTIAVDQSSGNVFIPSWSGSPLYKRIEKFDKNLNFLTSQNIPYNWDIIVPVADSENQILYIIISDYPTTKKIMKIAMADLSIITTIDETRICLAGIITSAASLPISSIYHKWHEPVVIV
jgi:hypothetical protein